MNGVTLIIQKSNITVYKNLILIFTIQKYAVIEWKQFIAMNPKVLYGKPIIKGTRIAVDLILEKLAEGETFDDILKAYPHITTQQILACMAFASEHIRNESVYPLVS